MNSSHGEPMIKMRGIRISLHTPFDTFCENDDDLRIHAYEHGYGVWNGAVPVGVLSYYQAHITHRINFPNLQQMTPRVGCRSFETGNHYARQHPGSGFCD